MNGYDPDHWHHNVVFGLHYDLHANPADKELGKEATHDHIRAELTRIAPDIVQYDCKGHPGYAGYPTKVGAPAPGIVGDALRVYRDVARELGIPLLVHYSGIWDEAAIASHPEWANVDADGRRSRTIVCPNSDYVDTYMIPQLLEIVDWYDVDGFWIDGDNWAALPCYCDRCAEAFRRRVPGAAMPKSPEEPHWDEWLASQRESFEAYVDKYVGAVHARKPACKVCSNWMYSLRQPDEAKVAVDFLSGDFDHAFGINRANAEARLIDSRGLPWNLMAWGFYTGEKGFVGWSMKTAAHLCQEAAVVLACGGGVLVYNTPLRTGKLVGWQQAILAQAAMFCRERQEWSLHTRSVPQIAVLLHSGSYYKRNQPLYNFGAGNQGVEGALHVLLENGYHVDLVTEGRLAETIGRYAAVVVPEQDALDEATVRVLERYVGDGGVLVASGDKVADALGRLAGVAGDSGTIAADGYAYVPTEAGETATIAGPWRRVTLSSARSWRPLLTSPDPGSLAGSPAVTIASCGKGTVAAIHGPIFAQHYRTHYPRIRALVGELFAELAPPGLAKREGPAFVEMTLRSRDGRLLVHLVNRATSYPLSPSNPGVEDVPATGPFHVNVPCDYVPSRVGLGVGGTALRWEQAGGMLRIDVPSLHIHDVIVIE